MMRDETRNLLAFVALAFALSWLVWAPRALAARGVTGVPIPPNVGAFGPSVAGFVLAYATGGRGAVTDLARRAVDADFRWRWFLPILLLFPAINAGLLLLDLAGGGTLPALPWAGQPVVLAVGFVVVLLTAGPLQEEFGWRGFALDRLQSRFSALVAGVVLGLIWAAWHLPLFLFDASIYYRPENAVGFLPSIVLVSVLITWIYANTGGSLLGALLVHASFNFSHWALPVLESSSTREAYLVVLLVLTAAVVLVWGPRDLARGVPSS